MTEPSAPEPRAFQTQAQKLLKLMINSLYSNREIFLRELISNASDAIDRLRFEALSDESLLAEDAEFRIVVEFDKESGTVAVVDNGIGMSGDEAAEHLGTIARSGTEEFFERLTGDQRKDSALIGQFGVGFYSAFIVAREVEVLTRRAGETEGTRWWSSGEETFTVEPAADLPRGTRVTLSLKPDAQEFADDFRLRAVVRRYSDHVGVPVMMAKPDAGASADAGADAGDEAQAAGGDEARAELEAVNSATALWTRPRSEVGDEEYKEFYKHISHDFEDPAAWSHHRVEGKLEYTSLLYVPNSAPFDLWNRELPRGLKLYVQRVFIMDEADQFLPLYLRFVRGIVDSADLPLNVSREILQQDDRARTIRAALTRRALDMLARMDADAYGKVWDEFGSVLKEGIGEDFANREALLGLLRFSSTRAPDGERVSLKDYIERMPGGDAADAAEPEEDAPAGAAEEAAEATAEAAAETKNAEGQEAEGEAAGEPAWAQDKIYYLVAEPDAARHSPHLEAFRERGIEVLLLTDRIDEWWVSFVDEYDGRKFQDVARGELDLDGAAAEAAAEEEGDAKALLDRIGEVLGDRVAGVRRSRRLIDSPACLVLGEHDMGAQMRRILEASGQSAPKATPHLEVNTGHPIIEHLEREADAGRFRDLALIVFDQAALSEGSAIADPGGYVQRVNGLIGELLGLSSR